ncbi:MAG TPA: argininosuccinate lyase [Acidimicrobiales bacterium]|nr:argininosuccinate lyase [Acidimicrobiales bacterium]
MTLWSGRMSTGPEDSMMAYTASIDFDQRLARYDIAGSIAHVHGLGRAHILSEEEIAVLIDALSKVRSEIDGATFALVASDEDIHTAIERRVTEIAGDTGAKLHTGRSRNDQVATALRLYARVVTTEIIAQVINLQSVLLERAREAGSIYLPGYTHLQRAQPVLLAHQLLAHGWALGRDVDRLRSSRERLNVSPLGAGALGGSSLPLDPEGVAHELGFTRNFENSIDAVSDRDFVAELLFDLALLGVHLSRIGEEIVIYSSEEFGFYLLADGWSTGSSMLPQKKNPDVAELARGKSGRMIGHLAGFLATLKSLPLAYNRDLQEDKEPLFDAVVQTERALVALSGLIASLEFQTIRMQAAADSESLVATDLAEYLVGKGIPFRQAHALVGDLVRRSISSATSLKLLVIESPHFDDDAGALFVPGSSVTRRASPGGGGTAPVADQIIAFADLVERERLENS